MSAKLNLVLLLVLVAMISQSFGEIRVKRGGHGGGGGGGYGGGPGAGGGARGPVYFCGYVGGKEGSGEITFTGKYYTPRPTYSKYSESVKNEKVVTEHAPLVGQTEKPNPEVSHTAPEPEKVKAAETQNTEGEKLRPTQAPALEKPKVRKGSRTLERRRTADLDGQMRLDYDDYWEDHPLLTFLLSRSR